MQAIDFLWLIPALPFAGAALNGALAYRRAPKAAVTAVALGAPLASLLVAAACIGQYLGGGLYPQAVERIGYAWTTGALTVNVAFLLDPLAAVMLFIVTFVGFLIHIYSVGYMGHDEGYARYFAYLNLFMAAMLTLVLGNNYLVMFVGWEGVGLCSYLLIGFYYDQEFPPYAGKKAFIVNRIGDFAFLIGMFALIARFGTLDFTPIFHRLAAQPGLGTAAYAGGLSFAAFVGLCFFIGAMGKSAQIPLYVWLPDAMAGPTPVSALIHAATMVTAGVYMAVRSNVIYQLTPGVSLFVAIIGTATALLAATIGMAQNDIKKVLAYSTVSQLGYMFMAVGVGAYSAALFHVLTHAFFKALLFLGSGSVIHAMGGEQDMQKMGGLKARLPVTYRTFVIGSLALAGIPVFAGFFSKDEILAAAAASGMPLHWLFWGVGWITAGLTAFYMFRAVYLTFDGKFRGSHEQEHHLHESPPVMTVPLVVLAVGAVAAGWVEIPLLRGTDWFHRFLEPMLAVVQGAGSLASAAAGATPRAIGEGELGTGAELVLILLSVGIAVAGIWLARSIYGGAAGAERGLVFEERYPTLHRLLANKWYVDEIYDACVVRPLHGLSWVFYRVVDALVIDGSVRAGAAVTRATGDLGSLTTTGNVRNYALYFFIGVIVLFWWIAR
ncbi:MAG TPA: NADH-quinone oxidoreductase subunit L [Thermoanaerobaculia bacterium]|nr:NADH-quinone oxidoreductase subunit L [Thermoanaerobaculia bacterium]